VHATLRTAFALALGLSPGCSRGDAGRPSFTTTFAETDPTGVDDGDDDGDGPWDSADATAGDTADDPEDPDDASTGDGPQAGGAGHCSQACEVVSDCVPAMADESDWACTEGFCEFTGPIPACDPAWCDDLMLGTCGSIGGVSACMQPCAGDGDCVEGSLCNSSDDDGNPICGAAPCGGVAEGEPCEIQSFGSIGTCTDGQCTCATDDECTADGFACHV
jgi:hypothetical protein